MAARFFLWTFLVLSALALLLLSVLGTRRMRLLRAERVRGEAADRLRDIAAALVMDGEAPPPLSPDDADLLAGVLWDFSRQITGSGREEIAQYFEEVGLVERQLGLLRGRNSWRRAQAAFVLGDACSARAVPALVEALRDEDADVRAAATRSLGRLRATGAAGAIVDAMADRRIPLALAGGMLIEIGAQGVSEISALLVHPDPRSRAVGLQLLGLLGSTDDTDRITPLLADPEPSVRAQACLALGRLGAGDVGAALLRMLTDPDPAVRAASAEALGELQDEDALDALLRQASDDEFDPARAAATAAARIDPDAVLRATTWPANSAHLGEAASRVRAGRR